MKTIINVAGFVGTLAAIHWLKDRKKKIAEKEFQRECEVKLLKMKIAKLEMELNEMKGA